MSDPRRNRHATATIVAVILVAAGIAVAVLLRSEPGEPRPPVAPEERNVRAQENVASAAAPADRSAAETPASDGANERDAQARPGIVDVRLRFTGARRTRVQFVVTDDDGVQIASAARRCDRDEVQADLTVPAHDWIRVGAFTFGEVSDDGAAVAQVRTKLGPGERQRVELECSGVVTHLRLVGPSARLLPHLAVELRAVPPTSSAAISQVHAKLKGHRDRQRFVVHPDADGTMRCHLPEDPVRASVAMSECPDVLLTDDHGAIDLAQRGVVIDVTPVEPLLGIVVERRGAVVPSTLSLLKPLYRHVPSPCEATTRRLGDAAAFVFGWTDELGPFRVPIAEVRRDGDVWVVEPAHGHRLGRLEVAFDEPPDPTSRLDLAATPLGGGAPHSFWRGTGRLRAVLPPDDYRLDWEWNGGRGPVAAEFVRIAGGTTTTLQLQPPLQQRWQVRLQLPRECTQGASLRLGGFFALGTSVDGVVPIDFPAPPRVGDRGEVILFALKATFTATVTAVDAGARRAEVSSTLADAQWLRLTAPPMAGGRTRMCLQPDPGTTAFPAFLDDNALVPVLPDHPRDGCVFEAIDGQDQLVRWFRVQAGTTPPPLLGQGRWTTLALERPCVRATILAEGPAAGEPIKVRDVQGAGPHRLFVAEGTRALHVDLEPGGRRTFDAALESFTVR